MIFLLMNRILSPLLSLRHIPLVLKQRFKVNNKILDSIYQFKLKTQPPQLLRIDKVKKKFKKCMFYLYFFKFWLKLNSKLNHYFHSKKNSLKVFCQLDLSSTIPLGVAIGWTPNPTHQLLMIDVGVTIALFAIDHFIPIGFKRIHRIF